MSQPEIQSKTYKKGRAMLAIASTVPAKGAAK